MADSIIICVDTREKRPLLFPSTLSLRGKRQSVQTVATTLPTGDYCLLGQASIALVERKGSILELRKNILAADIRRTRAALDRLCKSTDHPVLLFEASVQDLLLPTVAVPDPGPILQRFLDECTSRDISLLFVGQCLFPAKRRIVGELLLRILLSYAR